MVNRIDNNAPFGMLLKACEIVSEPHVNEAKNLHDLTGLPFGKCLVILECIDDHMLRSSLEGQALFRDGAISLTQLTKALAIVRRQEWLLGDALLSIGCDAHSTRRSRLGEILCDARVIPEEELAFALQIAELSCIRLGKILDWLCAVEQKSVDIALRMQALIRKGSFERDEAVGRIQILCAGSTSDLTSDIALAQLLISSKLISEQQLSEAIIEARKQSIPVCRFLVESGVISPALLTVALSTQCLVDEKTMSLDTGSSIVRDISKIQSACLLTEKTISFYEFMTASNYLSKSRFARLLSHHSEHLTPLEGIKLYKQDGSLLRQKLLEALPEDSTTINSGYVLHHLFTTGKLTVGQALLRFAFKQHKLSMSA